MNVKEIERQDMLETINDVSSTLDDALNMKEALAFDITVQRTDIQELERKKAVLNLKVKALGEMESLAVRLSDKERDVLFLKEKIRDFESEKGTYVSSKNSLLVSLEAARDSLTQIESTKHELWQKVQSLQEQLNTMCDLKRQFSISENEKDITKKKLTAVENQLRDTLEENNILKWNVRSIQETFEDIKNARHEQETKHENMESEVIRARVELADLRDERKVASEKISSIESQLKIADMSKDKLEAEFITTKEMFEVASREKAHLKEKILELEEKARPAKEFISKIEELEIERNQLAQRIQSLETEVASQEVSKTIVEGDLAGTKKAMGELKFIQEDLKAKLEAMTKKAFDGQQLELRIEKLELEKGNTLDQINTLQSRIDSLQKAKNDFQSTLLKNEKSVEQAQEDKHRLELRFIPLMEKENIVLELEEKLAREVDDKREAVERVKTIEEQLSHMIIDTKEVNSFREQLRKANEHVSALKRQMIVLENDKRSLQKGTQSDIKLEWALKENETLRKEREGLQRDLELGKKDGVQGQGVGSDFLRNENVVLKRDIEFLKTHSQSGSSGLDYIKQSLAKSEVSRKALESRLEGRESMTKALEEALSEIEVLKGENCKLKRSSSDDDDTEYALEQSEEKCKKLERKISALKNEIEEVNADDVKLKRSMASGGTKEDVEDAQKEQIRLMKELAEAKRSVRESEETIFSLKMENARQTKSLAEIPDQDVVTKMERDLEKARTKNDELNDEIEELRKNTQKGSSGLEYIKKSLSESESSRQKLESRLEGRESMTKALEGLISENVALKKEIDQIKEVEESLERSEKQKDALKKQLLELQDQVDELKEESKKIRGSKVSNAAIKETIEKTEEENLVLRKKLDTSSMMLEEVNDEKNALELLVKKSENENTKFKKDIEVLEVFKKESGKLREDASKYDDAEAALEKSEAQRTDLKQKLNDFETEVASLKEESKKLKEAVADQSAKGLSEVDKKEQERLTNELAIIEKKLSASENMVGVLTTENGKLKASAVDESSLEDVEAAKEAQAKLMIKLETLETRFKESQENVSMLTKENEKQKKMLAEVPDQDVVTKMEINLEKARGKNDELLLKFDELSAEIEDLKDENDDLKSGGGGTSGDGEELARVTKEKDALTGKLSDAVAKIEEVTSQKDDFVSKLNEAQESAKSDAGVDAAGLATITEEKDALTEKLNKALEKIEEVEIEKDSLISKLDESEEKIEELEEKVEDLS